MSDPKQNEFNARLVAALSDPAVRAKVIEITIGRSLQKIGASLEKRAVDAVALAAVPNAEHVRRRPRQQLEVAPTQIPEPSRGVIVLTMAVRLSRLSLERARSILQWLQKVSPFPDAKSPSLQVLARLRRRRGLLKAVRKGRAAS